jgi:hypothetical protein
MSQSSSSSAVPEKPRRKKDTVLTMLAGGIAGAIEAGATWPVEYIKTHTCAILNIRIGSVTIRIKITVINIQV